MPAVSRYCRLVVLVLAAVGSLTWVTPVSAYCRPVGEIMALQSNTPQCPDSLPQYCPSIQGSSGNGSDSASSCCISNKDLCILEPVPGGVSVIRAVDTQNMGAFWTYLNGAPGGSGVQGIWDWAFGIGIGVAVFSGLVGGLQIVLSNGDSGKIDGGKNKFFWAVIGLLVLFLSGVILSFINPYGFQNGI